MSDPLIKSLGRISGPLLKDNLLRQGTDLAFETDLLYLNVTDKRIGINTDAPVYTLDVIGTTKTPDLSTPNTAFLANFVVATPDSSFTPTVGDATISPLQDNPEVLFNRITTDSLDFNENYIASFDGANIVFSPAGTGSIDLQASTHISGDLYVTGNIALNGDLRTLSNLIIGDQSTDTVSLIAKFGTGLRPVEDDTFDLGEPDFQWRDFYGTVVAVDDAFSVGNFSISPLGNISVPSGSITISPADPDPTVFFEQINTSGLDFNGNVISSLDGQDIVLVASGTGTIELNGNTNVVGDLSITENLTVDGDVDFPSELSLGNGVDTEIIINSSIEGDLIPDQTLLYDIGSLDFRWNSVYVDTAYINQTSIIADITLTPNGNVSVDSGSIIIQSNVDAQFEQILTSGFNINGNVIESVAGQNIIFNPTGTGIVDLNSDTNITGSVSVTNNLTVNTDIDVNGDVTLGDGTTTTINAKLQNSLIPDQNVAYNIGSSDFRWSEVYVSNAFIAQTSRVADFTLSNQGNISVSLGSITIDSALDAQFEQILTGSFDINGNVIQSINNQNIIFDTSGSGTIDLNSDTNVTGTLTVSDDLLVNNDFIVTENSILGDGTITTINAKLQNNLIPDDDIIYDIGSSAHRWKSIYSNTAIVSNSLEVADFSIDFQGNIENNSGSIFVNVLGNNPTAFFNKIENSSLFFDGNLISSFENQDIVLDPSGTGSINLLADTKLFGDLDVSGNINLDGNLSTTSNIIIGDQIVDVIIINTDFTQEINPGQDITYDLGTALKRWSNLYVDSTTPIENYVISNTLTVDNSFFIDGINSALRPVTTGTALNLLPGSGSTIIESIKFEDDTITNLENTPLTLTATGIGYYRFSGNNGIVLPAGDTSTRPSTPEVGDTRWNTQLGYLECFDGNVYQLSTGPSNVATIEFMEDATNLYALILG